MAMKELTEKISILFEKRSNTASPFIIGIDGLGGAGKTSLVKEIEQELTNDSLKVTTFHLDDHIVERSKRYQTGNEEWYEYYYLQWDIKDLEKNLFNPLHNNCKNILLPFYDNLTDTISTNKIKVPTNSIVLIEGIFLQRQEWKRFFDFTIFLDCSKELRQKRVLDRDFYIGDYQARLHKYQRRYWLAEKYYLDTVQPLKTADVVMKSPNY